MKEALMERLKIFLHREDNKTLVGIPASQEDIAQAQQRLHVHFHEDYVQFIRTFGGAYAGLRYMHSLMALVLERNRSSI